MGDESRRDQVAAAHRAGVTIVSGTDGGIGPGKPHGTLPIAVADLVAGGMSAADALATATSVAAAACGLSDRKGHIRPATTPTLSSSTQTHRPTSAHC
jgi:imidazolonepropionase-like amidohydrolase